MIPIILVTAHSETADILRGFETGADDYLIKPFNYTEMLARVRSMLRIRDTQQMLMRVNGALETRACGEIGFKGFSKPQAVYEIIQN